MDIRPGAAHTVYYYIMGKSGWQAGEWEQSLNFSLFSQPEPPAGRAFVINLFAKGRRFLSQKISRFAEMLRNDPLYYGRKSTNIPGKPYICRTKTNKTGVFSTRSVENTARNHMAFFPKRKIWKGKIVKKALQSWRKWFIITNEFEDMISDLFCAGRAEDICVRKRMLT